MTEEEARKLADNLTSNHCIILAIRWWVEVLIVEKYTCPGRPQREGHRKVNSEWKHHLRGAGRVLGLSHRKNKDRTYSSRLPYGYVRNLRDRTGLDLEDWRTKRDFGLLPLHFPLEDRLTERFSEQHPHVLDRAKDWLLQSANWLLNLSSNVTLAPLSYPRWARDSGSVFRLTFDK